MKEFDFIILLCFPEAQCPPRPADHELSEHTPPAVLFATVSVKAARRAEHPWKASELLLLQGEGNWMSTQHCRSSGVAFGVGPEVLSNVTLPRKDTSAPAQGKAAAPFASVSAAEPTCLLL